MKVSCFKAVVIDSRTGEAFSRKYNAEGIDRARNYAGYQWPKEKGFNVKAVRLVGEAMDSRGPNSLFG